MITYDAPLFKNLIARLQTLIQTNLTFFDETTALTEVCTSPANPFCEIVKRRLLDRCLQTDDEALNACRCNSSDHAYACHFGMTEAVFKMTHDGETYGYIMVGPFRTEDDDINVFKNIRRFCLHYGEDEEEMKKRYLATSVFTPERFEAIRTLLRATFDYAVHGNIVSMKHSTLETMLASYINEHLADPLSSDALCRRFFLSQKQLYRLIKRATGSPPKQYILRQRLAEAKRLISSTDQPLQTVAESVGMFDYSHFIKLFKAETGLTPSAYRNRFQSNPDGAKR